MSWWGEGAQLCEASKNGFNQSVNAGLRRKYEDKMSVCESKPIHEMVMGPRCGLRGAPACMAFYEMRMLAEDV